MSTSLYQSFMTRALATMANLFGPASPWKTRFPSPASKSFSPAHYLFSAGTVRSRLSGNYTKKGPGRKHMKGPGRKTAAGKLARKMGSQR